MINNATRAGNNLAASLNTQTLKEPLQNPRNI